MSHRCLLKWALQGTLAALGTHQSTFPFPPNHKRRWSHMGRATHWHWHWHRVALMGSSLPAAEGAVFSERKEGHIQALCMGSSCGAWLWANWPWPPGWCSAALSLHQAPCRPGSELAGLLQALSHLVAAGHDLCLRHSRLLATPDRAGILHLFACFWLIPVPTGACKCHRAVFSHRWVPSVQRGAWRPAGPQSVTLSGKLTNG